jgi:hypothetical protein
MPGGTAWSIEPAHPNERGVVAPFGIGSDDVLICLA